MAHKVKLPTAISQEALDGHGSERSDELQNFILVSIGLEIQHCLTKSELKIRKINE
jgi:hypothetical protein